MKRVHCFSARAFAAAAALIAAALLFLPALADSYSSSNMRLARFEGDVTVEDETGSPRFIMENIRLAGGDTLITGPGASASVSLDDGRILTVDSESRVGFSVSGSSMVLTLQGGSIMLDVSSKLNENESLDIQTSTMVVGIRGTVIVVSDRGAGENGRTSTACLLEGPSSISYTDESGQAHSVSLKSGQ